MSETLHVKSSGRGLAYNRDCNAVSLPGITGRLLRARPKGGPVLAGTADHFFLQNQHHIYSHPVSLTTSPFKLRCSSMRRFLVSKLMTGRLQAQGSGAWDPDSDDTAERNTDPRLPRVPRSRNEWGLDLQLEDSGDRHGPLLRLGLSFHLGSQKSSALQSCPCRGVCLIP